MKRFFLAFTLLSLAFQGQAQVKAPAPSPAAKIEQTVGLTDISITYSRPGMKGRTVFGDLVPYGKVWRTGANKAVQVEVSTDIQVEGKDLKKGHYALFTKPNKDNWDIIFYKETEIWGTPDVWVDTMVTLSVNVKTRALLDPVESFTISIDNIVDGKKADLNISWEKTLVKVQLEAPTEKITMASIESTMAGPSGNDYYRAAAYYLESGKDLKQAYEWIKKASAMNGDDAFWISRRQSLIEAELGMYKEAIATAEKSMAAAEKAGNADYVKMNKDSIAEWSKKK